MIQNIIQKREAQRVWLRLCEWTEWRSVSRAGRFESMHLVWFRCVWRVLYMLNGFLTSHSLWNGQSAQIALAECALKALEYILPTKNERNGERVRKRGRKMRVVCERERERENQRKKENKIAFTVQAASEIIFHISGTAWAQWEREYDFLHTVPTEKKNLSQSKREESREEKERGTCWPLHQ